MIPANPGHTRATTADIARALGLSKMTVSRALRGERYVAPATLKRIKAAATRLGYRPDPAVSELMGHLRKSRTTGLEPLAWLTTYATIGGWRTNHNTLGMFQGATAQAEKLGYRLEEFSVNLPGMTPRRLGAILRSRSIRGILVAPLLTHGAIKGFPWQHFAAACCGPSLLRPALHRVYVDQFEIFCSAWRHLTRRGYRRIGLCVSQTDNERVGRRWQSALLLEHDSLPAARRVPPMITDDWTIDVFTKWYRQNKPDVIISFHEVYDWMKKADIKVPNECGFAVLRQNDTLGLAGVDHRFPAIGAAAVEILAGELNANHYGLPRVRKIVSIECNWQDGSTIRSHA